MSIACLYDQFVGKPLPALGHRALVFSSISMRSFYFKTHALVSGSWHRGTCAAPCCRWASLMASRNALGREKVGMQGL